MIAFRDNLPLIKFGSGHVTAFERAWLRSALEAAANKAGYPKWWLADDVTESVTKYFEMQFADPVVSTDRLDHAVRSVLQVIGYSEVALHFHPLPPQIRISLEDLAEKAGAGYELAFFGILASQLQELQSGGIDSIRFDGLQACVKTLRAAKAWRADCRELRDHIVAFLRARLEENGQRPTTIILT